MGTFLGSSSSLLCWHTGPSTAGFPVITSKRATHVSIHEKKCHIQDKACSKEEYTVMEGSDVFYRLGCSFSFPENKTQSKGAGVSSISYCDSDHCNSIASHPEKDDLPQLRLRPQSFQAMARSTNSGAAAVVSVVLLLVAVITVI